VYVTLAPALYLLRHLKQVCQIFVGAWYQNWKKILTLHT
jgi:hypothetical protein